MDVIGFIIVGIVAGWLAGKLMKGKGFGLIGDLIVGVIGAYLGGWIFESLDISTGEGFIGSLITALVGAIILFFLRLIARLPAVYTTPM